MFSFRRKPRKTDTPANGAPLIRASPSLPELSAQGIPWPSNLVDLSSLPQADAPQPRPQGKSTSGRISSLYVSSQTLPPPPPSAFETRKQPAHARARISQRKARAPTTFNIMVVGGQGTGKTSLLRLLLDTADISPTASPEQRATMGSFLHGTPKRTDAIQSVCLEICESKYDRVLLSVIDTPGLDFQEGHELKLERQVGSVMKYLDSQFTDTLSEESKVMRQSKGDQHVHLCIYMIDPKSIMSASLRRALSSLPAKTRSDATVHHPPDLSSFSDDATSDDTEDESAGELKMSSGDINVLRRLMTRTNVLPVLSRADSLTDDTLAEMKRVVRRDLRTAGLDFGVFGPVKEEPGAEAKPDARQSETERRDASDSEEEAPVEERRSRPVIKLRAPRLPFARRSSRSRSRMSLSELAANEQAEPDTTDAESVASVRFSADVVSKTDLSESMPFALISPEEVRRRRPLKPSVSAHDRHSMHEPLRSTAPSDDGHANSAIESRCTTPATPTTPASGRHFSYLAGPPADLKGVFIRKFRWGTVDVLNPEHCDFAAMRTAVLSTHMKMLKIRTREVLYEKFRTEKLLARRATRNISEVETRKLLADLGF